MDDKELEKEILKIAKGSKITCKEATDLALRVGIPTQEMGRLLDKCKIKLVSCQMGCF